jgi:hypothetical protein
MKPCRKCGASERNPSGQCRPCTAAYRARNAEKIKARKAAYSARNAEKIKARMAAYYARNAEKIKAHVAAYRARNAEKINAATRARYYAIDDPRDLEALFWRTAAAQRVRMQDPETRARYNAAALARYYAKKKQQPKEST